MTDTFSPDLMARDDLSHLLQAPSVSQEIQELHSLFSTAEKRIKHVEKHCLELATPLINELRYAAHHLLRALTAQGSISIDDLHSAKKHCKRTIFDSSEIIIIDCLEQIRNFQKEFEVIELSPVIPDYLTHIKRVREIKDFVSDCSSMEKKEESYHKATELSEELKKIVYILEDSKEEVRKAVKKQWQSSTFKVIGLTAGIATAIATVIKVFFF